MKTKTLGWIAALGMAGTVAGFGGCSQPRTECQVALASTVYAYAAKFTVKTPPAAGCEGIVVPGDTFGMEFYHPATADKTTYDQTKTTFTIQSESLGGEARAREGAAGYVADRGMGCDTEPNPCLDSNEAHHAYSLGTFASPEPDESDACTGEVKITDAATVDFPAIPAVPEGADPENEPAQDEIPAKKATYEWSKIKFHVTAAAPGTQFSAELKYTENGCTVVYDVIAMWPAIYCDVYDADGNPVLDADGNSTFDDKLCNPCPPEGAAYGSGISPDFPTKCDTELALCTLRDAKDKTSDARSIPQLLDAPIDCGPVE